MIRFAALPLMALPVIALSGESYTNTTGFNAGWCTAIIQLVQHSMKDGVVSKEVSDFLDDKVAKSGVSAEKLGAACKQEIQLHKEMKLKLGLKS